MSSAFVGGVNLDDGIDLDDGLDRADDLEEDGTSFRSFSTVRANCVVQWIKLKII